MEKPTMNFTINGAKNMDLKFGQQGYFENTRERLLNGGDVVTALSEYGDMLFQDVKTPFGHISISRYNIIHDVEKPLKLTPVRHQKGTLSAIPN